MAFATACALILVADAFVWILAYRSLSGEGSLGLRIGATNVVTACFNILLVLGLVLVKGVL